MERLCIIGLLSSLVCFIICSCLIIEFPKSSDCIESLKWIGTINGRSLPDFIKIESQGHQASLDI